MLLVSLLLLASLMLWAFLLFLWCLVIFAAVDAAGLIVLVAVGSLHRVPDVALNSQESVGIPTVAPIFIIVSGIPADTGVLCS